MACSQQVSQSSRNGGGTRPVNGGIVAPVRDPLPLHARATIFRARQDRAFAPGLAKAGTGLFRHFNPAGGKAKESAMDSFELNKIIGAILGTLLFVMGAGFLAEAIYHPIEGRGPGYTLPEPEGDGASGPAEPEPVIDIGTLLASANADQGAQAAAKCKGCHNFEEGAGNKQGPVLYGVAGRQIAAVDGFAYGDALAAMGAEGQNWTYEHLNDFLLAPKSFAPGTKMNFGGLRNDAERANIIAYLASISPGAPDFPPPAPPADATAEVEAAMEADDAAPVVETEAEAIETPTETQSESPVEGTPVTETAPAAEEAPAMEAPAMEAPAMEAPAMDAPAMETVGPEATDQ